MKAERKMILINQSIHPSIIILSLVLSLLRVPPYAATSVINRGFAVLLAI